MIKTYLFITSSGDEIRIEAQSEQMAKLKFLDLLFQNGNVTVKTLDSN